MTSASGTNYSFYWRPTVEEFSAQFEHDISTDVGVVCLGAWDALQSTGLEAFSSALRAVAPHRTWTRKPLFVVPPMATVDRMLVEAKRPALEDSELEPYRQALGEWAGRMDGVIVVDGHKFTRHKVLEAHTDDGIHYGRAV